MENPILKALPPATDYITYLTILEFNLTADQLPTLHGVLQDTTLTANIGWDLVHLLLPLLPVSRDCLQDVARLGNPREVVLKVTELLQKLGRESEADVEDNDEPEDEDEGEYEDDHEEENEDEVKDLSDGNDERPKVLERKSSDTITMPSKPESGAIPPSRQLQFRTLLEMLSVLHPRIKTKYPSRFLMTSLQATFPAHPVLFADPSVMEAALGFIRAIYGASRPKLPPRKSSINTQSLATSKIAPDPEGQGDALGAHEPAIQSRLLQVYLTSTILHYMASLSSTRDIPGMAWCSRFQEKLRPKRIIHGRKTFSEMFVDEDELHGRDAIVGQIVALARDLKMQPEELLSTVIAPEKELPGEDADPPASASEVPLNQEGSFYLLCAKVAAYCLFDVPNSLPQLQIFPEYAAIVYNFFGDNSPPHIGSADEALVDAILFLGYFISNRTPKIVPPEDPNVFTGVLLQLSILSAESPSPTLRYHAHVLISSILHSHPSDSVRLGFIRDTLEHCSYENLKGSAIGWLMYELLEAEKIASKTTSSDASTSSTPISLFRSPSTISSLAHLLFPNPRTLPSTSSTEAGSAEFLAHHSFYLASLNLCYLLLSSPSLFSLLDIGKLTKEFDLRQNFLQPLREFGSFIGSSDGEAESGGEARMFAVLLEGNIQKVEVALRKEGL